MNKANKLNNFNHKNLQTLKTLKNLVMNKNSLNHKLILLIEIN